ncbi:MAG TPA: phage holin, LLH family [Anaerolineaceae bacterium]|nr:phage holin, LLH family [Anaerolineaceae bacterium]
MEWMPILSKVIEAVLITLLPPLVVALVGFLWSKAKEGWAKAKAWNPTITEYIEQAAEFAVIAAEQAGIAKLIEDKKQYALGVAKVWLEARNITADPELIAAAIEKAVLELFHPERVALPLIEAD